MQTEKKSVGKRMTPASFTSFAVCAPTASYGSSHNQAVLSIATRQSLQSGDTNVASLPLTNVWQADAASSNSRPSHERLFANTDETPFAPRSAIIHAVLCLKSLRQEDNAKGSADIEPGSALDGKSPYSALTQVMSQLQLKQYNKAPKSIKKPERQQPKIRRYKT